MELALAEKPPGALHRHNAVAGVHSLGEPRHRVAEGIKLQKQVVDVFDKRGGIRRFAECAAVFFQYVGYQIRKATVFNPKTLIANYSVQEVDSAGDRRALRGMNVEVGVERRSQKVAIAAPVVAQKLADVWKATIHVAA